MTPGAIRLVRGVAGVRPEVWRVGVAPGTDAGALRSRARRLADDLGSTTSRSYAGQWALVAAFAGPVGVDIEAVAPCTRTFADLICTPAEAADPRVTGNADVHLTALWSSKEALAKAMGDALDYAPDRLPSPVYWEGGRAGRWRAERVATPAGYVGWVCWALG